MIICGSGKRIRYSIQKYGMENHSKEILEFCEDKDSLYKREAELVNEQVLADPMNMNLRLGGKGGWDYANSINTLEKLKDAGVAGQKRT